MPLKKGYKDLIAEATAAIETIPAADAVALAENPDVQFVDLRDVRELEREGFVPGSFHAPRGMLEFWVDPESPYHKPALASGKRLVLYCQSGWRSALAAKTLKDMGVDRVAHIGGGFSGWREAGGAVAKREPRSH
ncbi:MAG: rhodanese-like domain-containing protein [Rhodospirillales bacterium]|nr:rhodanese-like domain-containing protein [Rhodospirillales bacterium]